MKYEIVQEKHKEIAGRTVYRIRALRDFETIDGTRVKAGDLGGYIEREKNLSQDGNAWVADEAIVCDFALVRDFAKACGKTVIKDDMIIEGITRIGESGRNN